MSERPMIVVIGAGGHAKVLIHALQLRGERIEGIIDSDPAKTGQSVLGVPVVGRDEWLAKHDPARVVLVNGLGSVGKTELRRGVYERFKRQGYLFFTVAHPAATVARDVSIEEGAQIMAGAVIQPGARIGANAIVNTGSIVDHDCVIGAHAHLAPGTVLSGSVTVGEGAHIGTGAVVIQGVTIGQNATIGAGATVLGDVAAGVTAVGIVKRAEK